MFYLSLLLIACLGVSAGARAETIASSAEMRTGLSLSRLSNDQAGDVQSELRVVTSEPHWFLHGTKSGFVFASRIALHDSGLAVRSASMKFDTKDLSYEIGALPVPIGGMAAQRVGADDLMRPRYLELLPFATWEPGAALQWDGFGEWRVVVWNDVIRNNEHPYRWNQQPHPTIAGSALSAWRTIQTVVQMGLYDNTKSHWVDLSLRSKRKTWDAEFSGHYRNESMRFPDAGFVRELGNVTLGFTTRLVYKLRRQKFFLEWSQFNVVQANETSLSADRDYNQFGRDENGELLGPVWDDHGRQVLLGYSYLWARGFRGFASLGAEQGVWQAPASDALETIRFVTANVGVILRAGNDGGEKRNGR